MTAKQRKPRRLRIYLDSSVLGAPFDRSGAAVYAQGARALALVLERVSRGEWEIVSSVWLEDETNEDGNRSRRSSKRRILRRSVGRTRLPETIIEARRLKWLGFGVVDAGHLASAELLRADVLLTTDGEFRDLAKQRRAEIRYHVEVLNPAVFLERWGGQEGGRP